VYKVSGGSELMCVEKVVIGDFYINDELFQSKEMSPLLCEKVLNLAIKYNRQIKSGMRKWKKWLIFEARTGQMVCHKNSIQVIFHQQTSTFGTISLSVIVNVYLSSIFPINRMEGDVLTGLEVKYDESICQWKLRSEV